MTEKQELINDIKRLKAERQKLRDQIRDYQSMETLASDSFHGLANHFEAMEKQRRIGQDYWTTVERFVTPQMEFIWERARRVKQIVQKERYDLLPQEMEELITEVHLLAEELGVELDELPETSPYFALPVDTTKN
ncbi:hypothetical protein [Streptococcus agalactiae]|uniref:Uncharacterized protein n=1 Tax=Streptococcus agalactiae MRI Z1-216 TaxID=1154879 RepID=A0AAD2WW79_STRAG|nr:hypothetical protein [Streptococcus agalactiae]EPU31249.1 hypothetical protein SAG0161_00460 [Streptococcus agalactiae MRI Z1-213]EPU36774.1 hypothetical protein SAG0162_05775 [Streptococcus agalactiae MRI Z1-214]EPU39630.1 hypothetical protein SAG0164_06265 [Streptococcus agalactiae MRI Z1-216]EPX08843.1 hypothetical protein SAG0165_07335 [Streptococcus agalactiae MRI Z1-217]